MQSSFHQKLIIVSFDLIDLFDSVAFIDFIEILSNAINNLEGGLDSLLSFMLQLSLHIERIIFPHQTIQLERLCYKSQKYLELNYLHEEQHVFNRR